MKRLVLLVIVLASLLATVSFSWELTAGDRTINVYNYFQGRYSAGPSVTDQFTIPRLRTDLWGDATKNVSYFLEYDYVTSPALVYGWIDYKTDWAKFTFGRFYLPFGLEYTTPPSKFDTIDPSNTLWYYFGYSRDIGLEVSNKVGGLKYYLALVNGYDNQNKDDNDSKDLSGRLVYSLFDSLNIGCSAYSGKTTSAEVERTIGGLEINWKPGKFGLKGEYIVGKINTTNSGGWYLQPMLSLSDIVQLLARYENWDPNSNLAGDAQTTTTLGLNFFFDKAVKLQMNYELKGEEVVATDNNVFLTQLQVDF